MHQFLKRSPILLAVTMTLTILVMGGCFRKHIESAPPVKRPASEPVIVESAAPEPAPEPEVVEAPAATEVQNPDIVAETFEVNAVEKPTLPEVDETDLGDPMTPAPVAESAPEAVPAEPVAAEAAVEQPVAAESAAKSAPVTEAAPITEAPAESASVEAAAVAAPSVEETAAQASEAPAESDEAAMASETAAEPETTTEAEPVEEQVEEAATEAPTAVAETETFVNPEEEVVEVDDGPEFMASTEMHYVQVGAFSISANAEKVLADIIAQGYEGSRITMSTKGLYLVRAGTFPDEAAAREALKKLKTQFPSCYVVKWDPAAK